MKEPGKAAPGSFSRVPPEPGVRCKAPMAMVCRVGLDRDDAASLGAYLHPDPRGPSSLEAQRRDWATCGYKGLARGAAALGGSMLTTEERSDGPVELTLEQVVTLRRPAWTSSEQQDDTEFYFDGVHFWRKPPGWLHQLTPPSEVPADGWPHSGECSCAVCRPRARLTA
jgi:hypothetical protein